LIRPTLEAMIAMLRSIHKPSHATAKQRLRQGTMEAMRAAIERELTLSAYEAGNRTRATVVMPRS
jgi:enoyl-CoA hydratase